jgi:hypothetical protein
MLADAAKGNIQLSRKSGQPETVCGSRDDGVAPLFAAKIGPHDDVQMHNKHGGFKGITTAWT